MRLPWQRKGPTLHQRVLRALERGGITIDELSVADKNGRVTLRGAVQDETTKQRAIELVCAVHGVDDVDDRLSLQPGPAGTVESDTPEEMLRVYVVQSGDTLGDIAERMLGTRRRWTELHDLNRGAVGRPDVLQPGLRLRLPDP